MRNYFYLFFFLDSDLSYSIAFISTKPTDRWRYSYRFQLLPVFHLQITAVRRIQLKLRFHTYQVCMVT